jgi:hypothetical protein
MFESAEFRVLFTRATPLRGASRATFLSAQVLEVRVDVTLYQNLIGRSRAFRHALEEGLREWATVRLND